ncbi:serine/arginine repetitive matrix protein 2-like isoform X1 [Pipra filicauda]|uniref:Serine/arginine repetitive matrix protein 2-like isoform X1 n=2 Tax=Pipra filicauda TaxID=649802 RepID=A0A6J2IR65_9PASS|nr:serine/arginine repetitive matrix protein 2-like isoform X1 [Pipra filicauda]XP_039243778.1 serine/arginine repetitive matrix protein 2-like isoform X1 [Pipra filicauda]
MSDREEEAPEGREPECLLCRRSDADLDICGDKIQKHGICAHVFCLYFASILDQQGNERVGLQGFLPRDILHAVKRAAQTSCCICGQSGATISCCETDCDLSFHLPCAKQGGCVTQFIPPYSSYCPAHSPQQAVEATPEPGTECLICMEPVEDRKTFNTMVCPACKTTWFHRDCIQGQALRSGFSSFQCPICRNRPAFLGEMFTMGIRIPFRPPTWEENDAFAELLDRHRRCDASECFYPRGRQEAEEEGPWELLLCSSCAAEGTHRYCSGVRNTITGWECDNCARQSSRRRRGTTVCADNCDCDSCAERFTSSSEFSILARLMEESPAVSTEDETINPSTSQQAASEQSVQSPSEETSSPSLYSRVTSRPSHSNIPETEDSSCSRSRRPDRRQNRTRRQSRPQNPQHRSRSPLDRSHVPEPTAARCRPRERQSGPSCRRRRSRRQSRPQNPHLRYPSPYDRRCSPHLRSPSPHDRICLPPPPSPRRRSHSEEASETSSNRNRSRQQRRPQNPHLRSRSRRHGSHVRTPRAGSCTATQEASETSRSRNRSRQQRRPQNPRLRSRSRRDRSHVPTPSTGRRRPSQEESGTSRRRNSSRRQSRTSNTSGRSRSPLDRNCTPAPSAGRRNSRETPARTSQRQQHSRQQRRTSDSSSRSRSRRDGRRDRAPSAGSPAHRSDGETGTPH